MTTPPASSATVNLTTSGSSGIVGDAVFSTSLLQPAGSGTFGTFVQIQGGATEQGYNTDFRPQQFDEKNSAPHNHALLLASVPIVEGDGTNGTIDGLLYREFVLDINEPNGQSRNFLSLDALQIFQAEVGNLTGFHQPLQQGGNGTGFGVNATLRYDLDAGGDSWIALNDGVGSGGADARVLIPNSFFDENTPYVILYSAFGYQGPSWAAQGGFEEWGTRGPQGNVPALNIAMTESVPGDTANVPGEVITYAITVRNMGNVSLTGVTVSDPFVSDLMRGADIVGNNDNVLNVGEIWSYSAHHTVTQADIDSNGSGDAGAIVNTATADSNQTGPDSVSVSTPVERAAQLEIAKEADVASVDAAGDVINYTISIENSGSTTLANPVVTDLVPVPVPDLAAPIENPNAGVFISVRNGDFNLGDTNENGVQDLGETFQYVYPGDISMDGIHDPGETWVAFNLGDTDQDGVHDAGETWVGDTNQNGIEEAGERWQFQNLGDLNHNDFQDPGEIWQYANVGDSNLNGVEDPGETFVVRNIGDTNQNGIEDPGETFEYYNAGDTNQNGEEDPGETFQFTTVPQALPGIDADSNGVNDGDADGDGVVDPGETWLYQGPTHTVTQEEIDNGGIVDPNLSIDNTASASTDQTSPVTATASVHVVQDPEVTLLVAGTLNDDLVVNGRPDAGETISYALTVTNSGNMTLYDIAVSDPVVTVSGTTIASLAPSASDGTSFTGSYVIQQADIDAGFFDNTSTADASAGAPGGFAVDDEDGEHVVLPQDPSLIVDNSGAWADGDADGFADVGELVNYVITVFNDGNVTLHDVEVNDTVLGGPLSGPASGDADNDGLLDVGETWTYNASYAITQDDIDAGTVHNDATGAALGPQDQPATDTDGNDAALPQDPSLTLDNTGTWVDGDDDDFADVGELVNYVITVVNDGNVTLHDVEVSDTLLGTLSTHIETGGTGTNGDGILDAGETWTYNADYAITQADIDAGTVHSDATAAALGPQDQPVTDTDGSDAELPQNPSLAAAMAASIPGDDTDGKIDSPADDITYTISLVNDGNVTLHNVAFVDPSLGALSGPTESGGTGSNTDGFLDVGETWTYTAFYDVEQSDIDNRGNIDGTTDDNIRNEIAVTTDEMAGGSAFADVAIDYRPEMELVKTGTLVDANSNGIAEEGELIDYIFTINNIGNVTLTNIDVIDDFPGVTVTGATIASLAPGASDNSSWGAEHIITSDDVLAGLFHNEATAVAAEASAIGKLDFLF